MESRWNSRKKHFLNYFLHKQKLGQVCPLIHLSFHSFIHSRMLWRSLGTFPLSRPVQHTDVTSEGWSVACRLVIIWDKTGRCRVLQRRESLTQFQRKSFSQSAGWVGWHQWAEETAPAKAGRGDRADVASSLLRIYAEWTKPHKRPILCDPTYRRCLKQSHS